MPSPSHHRLHAAPATLLLSSLLLCSCGGNDTLPGPQQTTSTATGSSAGGNDTGGNGGSGGAGATTSAGGSGGSTTGSGGSGASLCGNDLIDVGESCDGATLGGASCQGQGYPGGALACNADCSFDISQCTGADDCTDGVDNDGDLLVDCEESDCTAACADACLSPVFLMDPAQAIGSTVGHAGALKSSCVAASGPEVVYQITAASTGILDVVLIEQELAGFSLSLRSTCAGDGSELACSNVYAPNQAKSKQLSWPVTAGQTLFVVVDGDGADAAGAYSLGVQSHEIACGDSMQDLPESCDDGNTTGGDGCSATCAVEVSEQEPNGSLAQANTYASPWFAEISPLGDVDYVKIALPATATLVATTAGVGDGTCADGSLDSYLTVLDGAGNALKSNDDAGPGNFCSQVAVPNLAPGDYYVRVEASGPFPAEAATFPYQLMLQTFQCGDGTLSPGEECDDDNLAAGDGCSPTCTLEPDESEPNDVIAMADVYSAPWVGRIDPDDDIDVVSIQVAAAGSALVVKTSDPTGGAGCMSSIDTNVEILDSAGTVIEMNDDALGYCSQVTASDLPAGKYYVRVQAPPLLGQFTSYVFPYGLDITVQ